MGTWEVSLMLGRDYTPPIEWERAIAIGAALTLIAVLGVLPGALMGAIWDLAHVVRRLFPLPLIVTCLGLAAIGFMGHPALAAEACGAASWYGNEHHGRLTASGARFDQWAMTAAHRTLPFGTMVTVRLGDRSVTVEVTDRGPFVAGRIIDLSRGAAERLGMIRAGVARVCLEWDGGAP